MPTTTFNNVFKDIKMQMLLLEIPYIKHPDMHIWGNRSFRFKIYTEGAHIIKAPKETIIAKEIKSGIFFKALMGEHTKHFDSIEIGFDAFLEMYYGDWQRIKNGSFNCWL